METVAHESYHLLGYTNEAQVDCYGMQSLWFVATRLGASVAGGAGVRRTVLRDRIYPLRRTETPVYWSPAVPRRRQLRPAPGAARLAES